MMDTIQAYIEIAGAAALNGVWAARWWPDLSGPLRRPIGRAIIGALMGIVWTVFIQRYSPIPGGQNLMLHALLIVAGCWAMGGAQWGYRSTYLWMVSVNLPLGLLHWPSVLMVIFAGFLAAKNLVTIADAGLLLIVGVALWAGCLHAMIATRRAALPAARKRNVRRLFAWLSHTPVWPPPPMPEELPPTEIMEDIEGGWSRFLAQNQPTIEQPQ